MGGRRKTMRDGKKKGGGRIKLTRGETKFGENPDQTPSFRDEKRGRKGERKRKRKESAHAAEKTPRTPQKKRKWKRTPIPRTHAGPLRGRVGGK